MGGKAGRSEGEIRTDIYIIVAVYPTQINIFGFTGKQPEDILETGKYEIYIPNGKSEPRISIDTQARMRRG